MSRIIQQIATVQFQVDNRKVTASMNALQTEAESLNGKIAAVNQNIKNLGDVPPDNKFLLEYQKQLRQLNSDLKDVTTAQRDLMKGVKAADQLWKAAQTLDIESLSIKAIKAGQNGLRKRMENLRPELGGDEQKMYDAYKAVIDEADRVMNVFKSNYATVVQTIRDGGIVSEQVMKSTRDALRDLMEAEKEGTAEHRQLAQQYDFLNESLANVAEMRRREKGEIVNANDARREALKLTEDGIATARRERDMADAVIAGMQQQKSDLDQLRRFHEDRIAQTEREIAANQRLEEAEQDRLADVEKAMRYTENEDRKEASRLRKKADAARDEAEAKKEAYEQQAEQEKLLRQHVKDTGDEVTNLTAKIEALGKTEAKPKVDTSALDAMKQEIADIESQLNEMGGMHTADMKAFNERLWHKQDKMKEVGAQNYKSLTTDPDADYFNFGNKAKKIIKSFAAGGDDRRHDLMYSLSERGGYLEKLKELESEHRAIVKQRTEYLRAMDETGKKDWEEAVRQLDELDSAYSTVISILKDYKQQFDKIKPADDAHMEKYEQLTERRATLLEKVASAEQQSTTATNDQTEAEKLYNQKVEERIRLEKELEAIKNRSWKDDPEIKRLDEEIAKLDELIAVSDKYKKQFAKMSDSKYGEGYMGGDSEVRKALHIESDPQKSIWGAADYLKGAYHDRSRASLAEFIKEKYPDDGTAAEYQKAAERVAKGIVQNAQENFRRAIYKEIQDGNWTSEAMEQQLDIFRSQFQNEFRNARPGELKDDPEYHYYKYVIEQMEKYIEVARQVEAEREKIAGGKVYMEMAHRKDDIDQPQEGLLRQREKRDWDRATIKTEDIDRRRIEDERVATEAVTKAKGEEAEAQRKLNKVKKESTQADQQSVDVSKQKAELEGQLADATKNHTKAQKDYEAQQEKTNKAQEKAYKAQEESVALNEKAATAEEKVAHQEEEHAKAMDQNSERLRQIRAEGQRMLDQYEQQKAAIQTVDKAWADADVKQGEAEARKAQNQELTIKSLDDSIRKLKEANAVIDTNSDEWEENTRIIQRLQAALDEIKNKPALMMMTDRMQDVSKLSTAAVTETRKFWEAMVAGAERGSKELAEYEGHLKTIAEEEKKRMQEEGQEALTFFRGGTANASVDDMKQQAEALRKYRDMLPREEQADVIAEINGYLLQTGQVAEKAAANLMSVGQAMKLATDAGKDGFEATEAEIKSAIAALEKAIEEEKKFIADYKKAGGKDKSYENELKERQEALRKLKIEQDNVGMSHKRMNEILKEPASAENLNELRAAIKRAKAELMGMEGSLNKNKQAYAEMAATVKKAEFQLKQMEAQAKGTANAFEKAWSRLKTYVTLYVGAAAAMQKLLATTEDLKELSDKMGEVQKTTRLSDEAVGRLSENLAKLDVRTPLTELMEISAAAGQLGLKSEEDIMGFTEAANMLMIALPEMGKEAATEMMRVAIATGEVDKIRKQMEEGLVEGSNATAVAMTKIASTIDRLRATSAATAPEITDFVKRVGAVGAQSGITIDQVSALGSTISSLGLRIEMSATALSRMIPAIRRNAFELSQAIGVSPEAIRSLFDAGRGMEAILMILQRMKDQNMDADSIEKMLGMGGMQEIMKDLNQQGARAGIVFAGLSQNVEQLRKQLVTANQAYEENTAIQKEFERMNETTAAKWERLKNQIEEAFVSDQSQRWLGWIIDQLRKLVDLLVGNNGLSAAVFTVMTLFGFLKVSAGAALWGAIAAGCTKVIDLFRNWRLAIELVTLKLREMTAAQWANVFLAIAAAVAMLLYKLQEMAEKANVVANEMAKLDAEILKQTKITDALFRVVGRTNAELEHAKEKLKEVEKANGDTTEAENKLKKASADHAAAIRDINSKYGQYLGYMLSETSSAVQLAKARDLVNAKLRETITLKQREAALSSVEQEYGGRVNKQAASVEQTLQTFYGSDNDRASRVSIAISEAAQKYANDSKKYQEAVKKILADNKIQRDVAESYMDTFEGYREAIEEYSKQENAVMNRFEARANAAKKDSRQKAVAALNSILGDWKQLVDDYRKAEGEEKEKLAVEVYKQQRSYANAVANNAEYFEGDKRKAVFDKNIKNMQTYEKGLRDVAGEAIRTVDALERAESKVSGIDYTNGGDSNKNPWGASLPSDSTAYADMNATALVNRRKQMKDFVNAIQTDTDVQSVLKEDAALKKAIEGGMSSDMRTVIEWYNTERLKIQDELYKRHLTNTGDWLDPKKSKESWRKQLQTDLDNYLKMLDAYYTKRKAEIQEAGNDEGLSEAEIRNRQLANDTEWQQRRLELQQIYLGKREKVAKDEVTAIMAILAEMDEDTPQMVEKLIGKSLDKWKILEEKAPEMARRLVSKFVSGVSQSMLKMQQIVAQQMKAIEDIIDKERPFNGITKNLRENLVTMGVLTADMTKERDQLMKENKDMGDFNRRQADEEVKRTTFLLGEAENAYSTTVEEVMARMGKAGMEAWAEEIRQSPKMQEALMAQLHQTYDAIQEAIKKEASLMKKQAETMWNNILLPGGNGKTTVKDAFEQAIAQLGIDQGRVSRANSLIGAGVQSERVADKLAIKQMQLQLTMQEHYYNLIRKQGMQRIKDLERQIELAKEEHDIEKQKRLEQDKQHVDMSLRLAMTKEQNELLKQQEDIIARTEESQNRLYTQLKEWGDLLASGMRDVFEASNAGNAEYYNELAKMNLTGKGGPGAGTYIVIDNEGTEDATAHYEYLSEREALERQREIEQQNAQAEAWKKLWDDLNNKMSEQITDWINASLQNQAIDANTTALGLNTQALYDFLNGITGGQSSDFSDASKLQRDANGMALDSNGQVVAPIQPTEVQQEGMPKPTGQMTDEEYQKTQENIGNTWTAYKEYGLEALQEMSDATAGMPSVVVNPYPKTEEEIEQIGQNTAAAANAAADAKIAASNRETETVVSNADKQKKATTEANNQEVKSTQSSFAKMAAACNMYGIAYQTMSNDNLDTFQKFQMFALQAAGQTAIAMLTTDMAKTDAEGAVKLPGIFGEAASQLGPIAGPIAFAAMTALLGGLMAVAVSKVAKSKSQISQVTGASASAGRLATGMMTYAEGNVNEFTDPSTLTPGRQYNVDGADGRTYRARYMGSNPSTHLTNGPEFHLAGERGREMIIDAGTTRQITMNENEIWHAIQTLSAGGRMPTTRRRGRGVRAFADGNVEDFESMDNGELTMDNGIGGTGFTPEQAAAFQSSLDRNNELLERALSEGIHARFDVYGKGGLIDSYDTGKKTVSRHGERY